MIEPDHPDLSIGRQCRLLSISRSSFYHSSLGETDTNLSLMLVIDKQVLDTPFYGVRQMTWHLRNEGHPVNEKRIRRLMLKRAGTRIPTDGKGRCIDNVFIERLWRSLKHDCVYLHARETGTQAKAGIAHWMTFYNNHRPHSSLGGTPPAVFHRRVIEQTQPDQQVQKVA